MVRSTDWQRRYSVTGLFSPLHLLSAIQDASTPRRSSRWRARRV